MLEHKTLSDLSVGEQARVADVGATGSMRRRLLDLGVIRGTRVRCLQKSPSGDPVAFLIRGATIALRTEDAHDVAVMPL